MALIEDMMLIFSLSKTSYNSGSNVYYAEICWCHIVTIFLRYELWKPNLRSMMESDMKEVSVGNKSKADVLANCLQQMKACFLDVRL